MTRLQSYFLKHIGIQSPSASWLLSAHITFGFQLITSEGMHTESYCKVNLRLNWEIQHVCFVR